MNYLKISVLMTVALMTAASCKSQFDSLLASNDAKRMHDRLIMSPVSQQVEA